jgi:fructokinase
VPIAGFGKRMCLWKIRLDRGARLFRGANRAKGQALRRSCDNKGVWVMILCCGDALVDMLPRLLENGSRAFLPVAGGALLNSAVTLGRLGENAGFISGISKDLFGTMVTDALKGAGVDCSNCLRSNRPSTLAFVQLNDGQAQYTFYDENSAARIIRPEDLPAAVKADAMLFGAISLIAEPCGSAYEALAERMHERCVIMLDPNIRPGFIDDEAAYRGRLDRMAAISDIIKVSQEDLEWIAQDRPSEERVGKWLAGATKLVLVTRGGGGALAVTAGRSVSVPAPAVKVVDTVGAGDSFNGGILSGLRRAGLLSKDGLEGIGEESLAEAVGFAVRVAAVTVSRPGADPPWLADIEG